MMRALVVHDDDRLELFVVHVVQRRPDCRHAQYEQEHVRGGAPEPRRQTEESPHPDQSIGGLGQRQGRLRCRMPPLIGLMRSAAVCGVVTLAVLTASVTSAWAQKTVIVVRHVERLDSSTDPPLSPAGLQRAQTLARTLSRAGVAAIFVTQFQRTQLTAAPLAAQLKITPIVMTANATAPLIERIRREHANDVVLVVGHSNTVPEILPQLGASEPVTIQDDEFDSLFILVPRGQASPSVVRLRF